MISISKRLLMAASLIPRCEVLADVGTDHGYLPVWLIQNRVASRVLASDVREGPLRRARETVERYALTDQIEVFLADGLSDPRSEAAEVVSICGMGGETMISILQTAPWTKENRALILQPQSKLAELEQWLRQNHYSVEGAKLCRDAGKLYLAMRVRGGAWMRGSEAWLASERDPLILDYLQQERRKVQYALDGLRHAQADRISETEKLERRLTELQAFEKEALAW